MESIEQSNLLQRKQQLESWLMSHSNNPNEPLIREEYKLTNKKLAEYEQ
jgi:hypothetical protein